MLTKTILLFVKHITFDILINKWKKKYVRKLFAEKKNNSNNNNNNKTMPEAEFKVFCMLNK